MLGCGGVWRKELKARKSGELSLGQWVPHYHALLWGLPARMDYEEERGEWVAVTPGPGGPWVETIHARNAEGERFAASVRQTAEGAKDRFREWLSRAWYESVGSGDLRHFEAGTRVEQIRERNGVRFYVAKYIGKAEEEASAASPHRCGRWWGVKGRRHIPWGELVEFPCSWKQSVILMRWARNYVRSVTGKDYRFSRCAMNVFVNDASQWLKLVESLLAEQKAMDFVRSPQL